MLTAVQIKYGGITPVWFRSINIIIHALCTLLLMGIVRIICARATTRWVQERAEFIAAGVGVLCAVHPVYTQTVAYVVQGHMEGLATLCILGAVYAFLCEYRYVAGAIALLSTGTKEIAIIIPVLLLFTEYVFNKKNITINYRYHAVLIASVLALYGYFLGINFFKNSLLLHAQAVNTPGNMIINPVGSGGIVKVFDFLRAQPGVLLHYVVILVWPFNLCPEYDWVIPSSWGSSEVVVPLLVLSTLAASIYYVWRSSGEKIILYCVGWFILCVAPRMTLIPSSELVADYKLYGASMGLLLVLVAALFWTIDSVVLWWGAEKKKHAPWVYSIVGITLMTFLGYTSAQRLQVWSSDLAFWHDVLVHCPRKARAYNNYGAALSRAGKYADAVYFLRRAISFQEDNYSEPYANLGAAYAHMGDSKSALRAYLIGMQVNSDHPELYYNAAVIMEKQGDFLRAKTLLKKALQLRRTYGKALFLLGNIARKSGDLYGAYEYFKQACTAADLDVSSAAWRTYARVAESIGYYDESKKAYAHAQKI